MGGMGGVVLAQNCSPSTVPQRGGGGGALFPCTVRFRFGTRTRAIPERFMHVCACDDKKIFQEVSWLLAFPLYAPHYRVQFGQFFCKSCISYWFPFPCTLKGAPSAWTNFVRGLHGPLAHSLVSWRVASANMLFAIFVPQFFGSLVFRGALFFAKKLVVTPRSLVRF